jgi:hypothetical protein
MRVLRKVGGVFCGLGLLAGAPAGALESASGSYEGKLVCKGIEGGERVKSKLSLEIGILDDGVEGIAVEIETFGLFGGFLLTDTGKPETGTLSAVSCPLSVTSRTGRALHAEVKIKAGSDKATLKGKLIGMDFPGLESALCELKAERVASLPPKLPVCP